MKNNAIFITKTHIFITTNDVRKNVYIQKMTEASRKRINDLLKTDKVYAYICNTGTVAISRL